MQRRKENKKMNNRSYFRINKSQNKGVTCGWAAP